MFYLTNFCRICVKSNGEMQDIESEDHDTIKFSDKLRWIYKKMVIEKEDHSKLICNDCVEKLRVSYLFQKMCAKSDQVFQQYLQEITSVHPESKFVNSELRVTIVPIPRIQIKCETVENPIQADSRVNITRTLVKIKNSTINYAKSENSSRTTNVHPKNNKLRRIMKNRTSFKISDAYQEKLKKLFQEKSSRITKEQRCTILKSLLSRSRTKSESSRAKEAQPQPRQILKKQSELRVLRPRPRSTKDTKTDSNSKPKGGLRDLLGFIKTYDFGYAIDENNIKQCDDTALGRLETFSRTFFYNDFQDYRDTILSIVDDTDSSDEDDMFCPFDEEEDRLLWPEYIETTRKIRVKQEFMERLRNATEEPNMSVKMEVFVENEPEHEQTQFPQILIKQEQEEFIDDSNDEMDDEDNFILPSEFVQTCYDDQPTDQTQLIQQQQEQNHLKSKINQAFEHFMYNMKSKLPDHNAQEPFVNSLCSGGGGGGNAIRSNSRISVIPEASTSSNLSNLDLLTRLAQSTSGLLPKSAGKSSQPHPPKSMTPYHMKCRTRGNPFINPQLMQQFQTRTFKCDTCNRSFKSPGYLHSHCTKMGH